MENLSSSEIRLWNESYFQSIHHLPTFYSSYPNETSMCYLTPFYPSTVLCYSTGQQFAAYLPQTCSYYPAFGYQPSINCSPSSGDSAVSWSEPSTSESTSSVESKSQDGSIENDECSKGREIECLESSQTQSGYNVYLGDEHLICIENGLRQTMAFVSAGSSDWGFQNPLGLILKLKKKISCVFQLASNFCFVKISPHNVKFSTRQQGVSYLIDESGTKTCWETFLSSKQISNINRFWMNKLSTKAESSSNIDNKETIHVVKEEAEFMANGEDLRKTCLTIGKTKISANIGDVMNQEGYVFFSTLVKNNKIKISVHCNGKSITVRYHTQTAHLGCNGNLNLRFPPQKKNEMKFDP